MTEYKRPISVLVVIYTAPSTGSATGARAGDNGRQALLLERADYPGYWQSVTGSCEPGEALRDTAVREVSEETGIDATLYALTDWHLQNVYDIYPQWRYRYAPGVTQNTEHVFGLKLPHPVAVELDPNEHLNFQWLEWHDAAEKVFSPSNRAAILQLAERERWPTETR